MLVIISPSKTLDFESKVPISDSSELRFASEANELVSHLRKLSSSDLIQLMSISKNLAQLNTTRFQEWQWPFSKEKSRQAIFAFKGDVFTGLDAYNLNVDNIRYCQNSLRILSGLYGLLRPLDTIIPYRLEMGTKFQTQNGGHLYAFWGNKISELLKKDMHETGHNILVNLASNEYAKAIDFKKLKYTTITPVFKDFKNGQYKVISIFAKKARGWMTRFIIENQLSDPDDLKAFDIGDYHFNNNLSKENELVFTRH